jgi:serine/threonine-protein kinase
METVNADRNMLFGILAVQMDFIGRDALSAAMNTWILNKSEPLGQVLVAQGALSADELALLEALVQKHLQRHGNDPAKSLAAANPGRLAAEALRQVADRDVQATLTQLPQAVPNVQATLIQSSQAVPACLDSGVPGASSLGTPTSSGLRFRALRPHARGGLGQVYVAHDEELHRDVALKEILGHHADNPGCRARFVLEAEITGGLEHPGVVPVYGLGSSPDGRPYYAMRFIKGESLQQAIDRFHQTGAPARDPAQRSLELRQLLGRFLAVCNTLAYAHSRGVIHRDLKPANIMLGPYGETLVVDWGLAKATGSPDAATSLGERALVPTSTGGSTATQMGSAIGTPAFMPPEQAAGEIDRLSPVSDVYSLGATLYALLTGQTPFPDRDVGTVLERVRTGDFRPPRAVRRDVPAALEAVCLKAMAREPSQRYAGALELAADIEHWLADEPVRAWREPWRLRARRWVKRHRTLVSTGAAAVLVALAGLAAATVLLGAANDRERSARQVAQQREQEARDQRDKAENNFKLARDAVDRFHTKVSENRLLNEPGFQPLRKELLETAMEFYERFVRERAGDPAVLADQARALARLASITNDIGAKPKAIELYQQALVIWEKLVKEHAEVPEYQSELAGCSYTVGELYESVGKNPDALAAYQKAVAAGEDLRRNHPTVSEYQRNLAKHLVLLGRMYFLLGQPDKSETVLRRALEVSEQCARDNPGIPDCQFSFIQSQIALAFSHGIRRQEAKAVALFEPARKQLEMLVQKNPGISKYQDALAQRLEGFGSVYFLNGQPGKAEETIRAGLAVREKMARENPRNLEYQEKLAGAHGAVIDFFVRAAVISRIPADVAKVEAAHRQALPALERLTRENPAVTKYRQQLAQAHHRIATFYDQINQTAKATAAEQLALDIREKLAGENRDVIDFQQELAETLEQMGDFYQAANQPARVEEAWRKAVEVWERLTTRPDVGINTFRSRHFRSQQASMYFKLGFLCLRARRKEQAEVEFGKAISLREKLVQEGYQGALSSTLLAHTLSMASNANEANGHSDQAVAAVGKALEIWQTLGRADRGNLEYRKEVASCHTRLGDLHSKAGRREQAEAAYNKSLATLEELPAPERAKAPQQQALADNYRGLWRLYRGAGLMQEAEAAHTKVIAIREGLASAEPNNITYQQQLGFAWDALGQTHSTADRCKEAERAYKKNLAIWEKLTAKEPNNVQFQAFLGESCNNLGWLAIRDNRLQDGLDWFARSAGTLQPLLEKGETNRFLRPTLVYAHWGRANALLRLGRLPESVAVWDLALKHDRGSSRDHLRLGRDCATALQGGHAEAVALAKELVDKAPQNEDILYNAVYVYCLASEAVRLDKALTTTARDKLVRQYTAEAFALLARAKTAGAFATPQRVGSLKTDKLLDPLRSGEPFKRFLAGVEGQIWVGRGNARVALGQWDRARADFARALEIDPENADISFRIALLHLRAGNTEGYRTLCADLLRRFAETQDSDTANTVAWTCTLAPGVADFVPVVRLAERAVAALPNSSDCVGTLGCARYRLAMASRSRPADLIRARRALDRACELEGKGGGPLEWLFLAMTHQQQRHPDEARRWFDKAVTWIAARDKPGKGAAPLDWTRRLELEFVRREAQQLLGVTKP